jgi:adenylate cyclase
VKTLYDWDWPSAEYEFRQAMKLGPNDADAHEGLGQYFIAVSKYAEAEAEFKKALQLDPLSFSAPSIHGKVFAGSAQVR